MRRPGRQCETPLCIASLHFEFCTFASAALEFEPPSGATDTRHRQRCGWRRTDTPTPRRCGQPRYRMPVVLDKADIRRWLIGEAGTELLKPAAEDRLRMWPVSRRVNKTGTGDDDPTMIEEKS